MRSAVILATLLSTAPLSLITATAFAQEAGGSVTADTANMPQSKSEDDPTIPGALVIGAGIGAIFPQPFTALDTNVAIDLEPSIKALRSSPVHAHFLPISFDRRAFASAEARLRALLNALHAAGLPVSRCRCGASPPYC